ncbi:uncharacterized protein LOC113391405 isoform X2 [Vanessa tameamea]|uniref:Uncharacterized protein LOC113391405 isoform X2 n=1 Tax=Vanessa tameamea TaxID=334116 RepID=A0ABM4AY64_VANTA
MSILFLFMLCFVTVLGANKHTKSLTESMGQEVIEINGPLKELPPDLEEEPSAENDDEKATSTTIQVATAKVVSEQVLENVKPDNLKDTEKIDRQKDDEEARIEKELADIYKDSLASSFNLIQTIRVKLTYSELPLMTSAARRASLAKVWYDYVANFGMQKHHFQNWILCNYDLYMCVFVKTISNINNKLIEIINK